MTFKILRLVGGRGPAPRPCIRGDLCWAKPGQVHYHWGYGQRHTSLTPVTGPGSFNDGKPYVKEG